MKVFVTGISGLLGLNAALQLRDRFEVSGCYLRHAVRIPDVDADRLDLADPEAVTQRLAKARPDLILHAAGLTNVDDCEQNPGLAERLNVDVSRTVASAAASQGAQFVHISTDHLSDGRTPMQKENDPPAPLNAYGRSKLDAERAVLSVCPAALVVRTNFFGWGPSHRRSFSDWVLDGLRARRPLYLFEDVHFSPTLVNALIDGILDLARAGASGIYNLAGGERLTKYSFGLDLASTFGFDPAPIRPAKLQDGHLLAVRPLETGLDCSRSEQVLGRRMLTIAKGLKDLRDLERNGWPEQIRSCSSAWRMAANAGA